MKSHYSYIIIWWWSWWLTMGISLAQSGKEVLLIEWKHLGWDCTNTGCVPSKAFIDIAKKQPWIWMAQALSQVREVRQWFLNHENSDYFIEHYNLPVVMWYARFIDNKSVEVLKQDWSTMLYTFGTCILATGSQVQIPSISGLSERRYFTTDTFFEHNEDVDDVDDLVIIWWGYIGCELANACYHLGIKVTIIQRNAHLIPQEDFEVSNFLSSYFRKLWITLYTGVWSMRFEGDDLIIIHESKEKKIHAKDCLIATGRKVDTRNLTLDLASIKADEQGIIVNDTNQTSNKHVYAIGDCVSGNPKFTHRADHEGLNLFQRLIIPFFWPTSYRDTVLPSTIYTDYEISHVGIHESQLRKEFDINDYKIITLPFSVNDKAKITHEDAWFLKIIFMRLTGKIVWATIVAKHSSEMIWLIVQSIESWISAWKLRKQIFQYPVQSHLIKKAATQFVVESLRNIKQELWRRLKKNAFKLWTIFFWWMLVLWFLYYQKITQMSFSDMGSWLLSFFQQNPRGPFLFMGFYAFRTLILFPAGITTIMWWVLFWPIGCIYVFLWENVSASIAWFIGKYLWVSTTPVKQKGIVATIKKYLKGNHFLSVLMLRLIPINFDMVNYVCGILGIRWKPYAAATAFGIIPGMVTYTLIWATFYGVKSLDFNSISLNTNYLIISIILYVVSFGLAFLVKKYMKDE